jgi:hypothetical protein
MAGDAIASCMIIYNSISWSMVYSNPPSMVQRLADASNHHRSNRCLNRLHMQHLPQFEPALKDGQLHLHPLVLKPGSQHSNPISGIGNAAGNLLQAFFIHCSGRVTRQDEERPGCALPCVEILIQ